MIVFVLKVTQLTHFDSKLETSHILIQYSKNKAAQSDFYLLRSLWNSILKRLGG